MKKYIFEGVNIYSGEFMRGSLLDLKSGMYIIPEEDDIELCTIPPSDWDKVNPKSIKLYEETFSGVEIRFNEQKILNAIIKKKECLRSKIIRVSFLTNEEYITIFNEYAYCVKGDLALIVYATFTFVDKTMAGYFVFDVNSNLLIDLYHDDVIIEER